MSNQDRENLRVASTNGDNTNARVTEEELLDFIPSDSPSALFDDWIAQGFLECTTPHGTQMGHRGQPAGNEGSNAQHQDPEDEYPDLWMMFEMEMDHPADSPPAGASGANAGSGNPAAASAATRSRNEAANSASSGAGRQEPRRR
ncbi:hypothetical protein N7493_007520 [Penicillium malachiteum]|uniref:Uncharacterized protein n=1 Tax=Penicillium malachiteum TaxID=1324776 RepID=A0AAD6MU40_9EURO|nr:hypothetical protein N7493_007520 [Penicillium malachiteum]